MRASTATPPASNSPLLPLASPEGAEPWLSQRRLDQLGLPRFDIFTARSEEAEISYCIAGDAESVLGPLAASSLNEVRR